MNQPKFSAYEMARQQLDAVAEKIHLDPNIHCVLRDVRRCVELPFPVMSLGSGLDFLLFVLCQPAAIEDCSPNAATRPATPLIFCTTRTTF